MVSTVRSRPSHYERLGLSPTASGEEIARAFARHMGMFRPMAETAQIGEAYETLRNPAKRRAYDAALGLRPEPLHSPTAVSFRVSARLIGAAPADAVVAVREEPAAGDLPRETQPEPGPGSFIAASLRAPVKPDDRRTSPAARLSPERRQRWQADVERALASKINSLGAGRARDDRSSGAEDGPVGLKRAGVAVGGLVVVAALVGAWAGLDAGDAQTPQPAQPVLKVALPRPRPAQDSIGQPPAATFGASEHRARWAAPVAPAARRTRPVKLAQGRSDESQSPVSGDEIGAAAQGTSEQAAAEALPEQTAAALPLSHAAIARTIERIGYSCGRVASASAVEGEARGVYKVTCTSGASYQATPVRGRYHFRRLGSL
jgi:curved DNA-binding protein CbpA